MCVIDITGHSDAPVWCKWRRSEQQCQGVLCFRQCNQTESAITQKVDLTTGHLVKLKTRHLHLLIEQQSLPSTGIGSPANWHRIKGQRNSVEDTTGITPHTHPPLLCCSSVYPSFHSLQKVSWSPWTAPPLGNSLPVWVWFGFLYFVMMHFISEGLGHSANMNLAIIFLCLASSVSAAPVSLKKRLFPLLSDQVLFYFPIIEIVLSASLSIFSQLFITWIITRDPDLSCHPLR